MGLPDPKSEYFTRDNVAKSLIRLNEVILCGFNELNEEQKSEVLDFVMDTDNWAKKRVVKEKSETEKSEAEMGGAPSWASAKYPSAMNKKSQPFPTGFDAGEVVKQNTISSASSTVSSSDSLVVKAQKTSSALVSSARFEIIRTNSNKNMLDGKTLVMTGVFPEVGGGAGLNYGKDRCKVNESY